MEERGGGMLAETRIQRADWRAEAASDALTTRIFLPTEEGLACLVPDAMGLSFSVRYHGESPALGSPVQFGERVWAPLLSADGRIKFVGLDLAGGNLVEVDVAQGDAESSGRLAGPQSLGRVAAPVTSLGAAIWVTEEGQLLLQRKANGSLEGSFARWPASIKPALKFGSPYLARDGLLWQLCLDKTRDPSGSFIYALLGRGAWEAWDAQPPRLCSGEFNFRFATKHHSEPWIEPEHGDDSSSDEVVVPVVESVGNRTVIGMKFKSTRGVEMLLSERERTLVKLVVDDADRQTEFDMFTVAKPLQLRIFVHDAHLWAYHPALPYLRGWAMGT
ncbi:hypothetical protein SAMN05444746_1443 [Variovorax sp. OK212]|nr:hypothetical protein SAMN05518853_1463 [Variovorax sp. OK202]SFE81204.1 hypothetical protein SAMN05444746_1443 [Variovorax sp. OK212]